MKHIVFIFIVCSLIACNANEEVHQENEQTVIGEDSVQTRSENELAETTVSFLNNSEIYKFAKSKSQAFDWNAFQLTKFWKEDSMYTRPFQPAKDYFEIYGRFLVYSPDSTKFVDLDSYNIDIQKNKSGQLIGSPQEPDTEVSLIDLKKKQKTRLVFLGPGNTVEDASWQDNENLILVGAVENNTGSTPNATIYKYHLPTKTFHLYETSDSTIVNNLKGYWKRERLKGVIMK